MFWRVLLFLGVTFTESVALADTTGDESCFSLGKKYGRCAYSVMLGRKCDPADDIVKPERCKSDQDFDWGIKAGIEEVVKKIGRKQR